MFFPKLVALEKPLIAVSASVCADPPLSYWLMVIMRSWTDLLIASAIDDPTSVMLARVAILMMP